MTQVERGPFGLERALRDLKKQVSRDRIREDLARHNVAKPSTRRRGKHLRAVRRRIKDGIN